MAPTITWYKLTGTGPTQTQITAVDFGNIQAGDWSDAVAIRANFSSSANSLRFWLYDTSGRVQSTDVNVGASGNWEHRYAISDTYINPTNITAAIKAGSTADPNGKIWALLPESQPSDSAQWVNSSVGDQGTGTGGNTDIIFLAVRPPGTATDGLTDSWGYRLSYLYP